MIRDTVRNAVGMFITNQGKVSNIEKSIYNFTIDEAKRLNIDPSWNETTFCHIYAQKYLDILVNLRTGPLKDLIVENKVEAKNIASLSPQQLNPDKWKTDLDDDAQEIVEGIFQCKKCGSKKTTYYSLQTRSSDEPMTNFITCVDCKNRWKM